MVGSQAAANETAGAITKIQSSANESKDADQEVAMSLPVSPLAGTSWRLVAFRSMDDATGTVHPDDPSLYAMRLNSDGTATMRLNCNRASGTWSAEPSGNDASGRFEFGPLAGKRALCPPPSLDEKFLAQAKFIRSYLLRDGRLYLSLMADGGIYAAWEWLVQIKTPEANIRVDLMVIWPVLAFLSAWALFRAFR